MRVVTAEQAPRFALPGVEFTGYAAPSRGSAGICAWRIAVAPGLRSEQAHTLDRDEVFLVVAGALRLTEDGPEVRAGDAATVPAGTPILLVNEQDEPAEAFVVVRAGFSAVMADGTPVGTPPWAR